MSDKNLSANDKLVYGQVASLTSAKGYCWANNKSIGESLNILGDTVSKCIKHLIEAGYIARRIKRNEKQQVIERHLAIKQPEFSDTDPDDGGTEQQSATPPVQKSGTSPTNIGDPSRMNMPSKIKGSITTTPDQGFDPIAETKKAVYHEHPLAFYQRTWGQTANGILNMEISNLANKYGNQLVNYAFYLAGISGKPYAYAKLGLLDNWAKAGLDTIQKVADNRAKYQAQKKQRKPSKYNQQQSNVTPIDTHQTTLNDRIRSVFINNNGDVNAVIKQFAVDDITVTADQIRGVMNERA